MVLDKRDPRQVLHEEREPLLARPKLFARQLARRRVGRHAEQAPPPRHNLLNLHFLAQPPLLSVAVITAVLVRIRRPPAQQRRLANPPRRERVLRMAALHPRAVVPASLRDLQRQHRLCPPLVLHPHPPSHPATTRPRILL